MTASKLEQLAPELKQTPVVYTLTKTSALTKGENEKAAPGQATDPVDLVNVLTGAKPNHGVGTTDGAHLLAVELLTDLVGAAPGLVEQVMKGLPAPKTNAGARAALVVEVAKTFAEEVIGRLPVGWDIHLGKEQILDWLEAAYEASALEPV